MGLMEVNGFRQTAAEWMSEVSALQARRDREAPPPRSEILGVVSRLLSQGGILVDEARQLQREQMSLLEDGGLLEEQALPLVENGPPFPEAFRPHLELIWHAQALTDTIHDRTPELIELDTQLWLTHCDELYGFPGYQRLANVLRRLRSTSGLTQDELARRIDQSQAQVSNLEAYRRQRRPPLKLLFDWGEACGFNVQLVFTPRSEMPDPPDDGQPGPDRHMIERGDLDRFEKRMQETFEELMQELGALRGRAPQHD